MAGLDREDYSTVVALESRYAELGLGLADCTLVILADRYGTTRILALTSASTSITGGRA